MTISLKFRSERVQGKWLQAVPASWLYPEYYPSLSAGEVKTLAVGSAGNKLSST